MPLRIACPAGHKLIVPSDRAGKTLRCPRCSAAFVVPGEMVPSSPLRVQEEGTQEAVVQSQVAVAERPAREFEAAQPEQLPRAEARLVKPKSRPRLPAGPPQAPAQSPAVPPPAAAPPPPPPSAVVELPPSLPAVLTDAALPAAPQAETSPAPPEPPAVAV